MKDYQTDFRSQAQTLLRGVFIQGVKEGNNVVARFKYEDEAVERLTKLFTDLYEQARPDGNSIVQPDLSEIPDNAHWVYFKGQKFAIDTFDSNIRKLVGDE